MKVLFIFCVAAVLVSGQIDEMVPIWKKCKEEMNITSRGLDQHKRNGDWKVVHDLQACVWTDYGLISSDGLINEDNLKIMMKAKSARDEEVSKDCAEKSNNRHQKPHEAIGTYNGCMWQDSLRGVDQ